MDTSKGGMKIRTLLSLEPGTIVHLKFKSDFILAEIRHCSEDDGVFYSGIQIIDTQMNESRAERKVAEEEGFEPPSELPR